MSCFFVSIHKLTERAKRNYSAEFTPQSILYGLMSDWAGIDQAVQIFQTISNDKETLLLRMSLASSIDPNTTPKSFEHRDF